MKPILLLQLAGLAVSAKLYERAICTVESLDDPEKDDAPAINSALRACAGGTTILPLGQTFNIQTPLNLSSCQACSFQIDGNLIISADWNKWKSQTAAIHIAGTTAAVITSQAKTGLIDASNFGWDGRESSPPETFPSLFSITDQSYQIHIRELRTKNVPGTAFSIASGSSAVRLYGIDFLDAASTGYHVEQSQHVYVWNNTIRATQACVSISPNSSNIQVEDSTCIVTGSASQSGFQVGFPDSSNSGLGFIRNIFVKSVRAIGSMSVVVFRPGTPEDGSQPYPVEITNATFTDITISGPAKQAVLVEAGDNKLTATDISFNDFKGEVEKDSELKCPVQEYVCEFETKDWELEVVAGS
ncbi:unnamed protein product [Periconia digitata]|uniref:Glycoside hydrolase family 28 protein n=1 Tax=Periconia digitata TaxID=1303443 RepID=A0A9W4UPQ6_9PLEO|nr:unnamed protein product [Periconia digitata]